MSNMDLKWRPLSGDLKIEYLPVGALKPRPGNPRTHTQKQIKQLAQSIAEFGFVNPILIDRNDFIVAGHGRVEGAKFLGMATVPTVRLEGLTEEQIRAYVIADNRLAELAGWDKALLAVELGNLSKVEVGFDLGVIGFEYGEIEAIIDAGSDVMANAALDDLPVLDPKQPVISKVNDCWTMGSHRILCGDATDPESYRRLLNGSVAQMVFTDPPYNVRINGHVSGLGKVQHDEFVMGCGEWSNSEFHGFLRRTFENLAAFSSNGSIHYICMDWRHIQVLLAASEGVYSEFKNLCVWAKTNAGMGNFYRSQHELVAVFKNGTGPHINTFKLGQYGRHRSNIWTYAGVNTFTRERMEELSLHPTVKPTALVADAIKDCSKRGGVVLDSFAGSGTIFVAAETAGRRAYGLELDPKYVDTAVRRWQKLTGEAAVHSDTGTPFDSTPAQSEEV